jgi:hypothetical protein
MGAIPPETSRLGGRGERILQWLDAKPPRGVRFAGLGFLSRLSSSPKFARKLPACSQRPSLKEEGVRDPLGYSKVEWRYRKRAAAAYFVPLDVP